MRACIERYFELDVAAYELVDSEREFELDVDGHEVVGFIDAVYRTPAGELVVVDYKATTRRRDVKRDKQLPIYLLACREIYDEPIERAGYAYVGDIGPELDARTFSDERLAAVRDDISETMARIETSTFDEYASGTHCRWCRHNGLPCAADVVTPDSL
ncbi:hypothetical protein GCM10009037_01180 [Halarchaeum grantii]|uniref:PD-(D/E)XK endonuclease-like domain-containing protein n=1 Tax=Halarchaeum grantii TaxID=1193105 RepID=A0A830ESV0_9EURY|nr:PD-(D/E)XK nuclease family protein [Halarchaeum grantii]GGL21636.1 hypothetical protein GCM10009037_01180 [Halarchaeum grantii]